MCSVCNLYRHLTDFDDDDDDDECDAADWTVCGKCNRRRPPLAHHCRRCGQCVRKMDHHCPWSATSLFSDTVW